MWVFTEIADWFDKTRKDNEAWIDSTLQPWVGSTLYDDSPWYRNVGIYTAAGALYSVNKFTTTVASGFVDVLRIGDGVQQGGWGYGKDALRLLMVIGPVLRGARFAVSLIPAVDASPTVGNCTWVAAARLLRLTGVRPLAQLSDVAMASGVDAAQTAGAWPSELGPALRSLGASVRVGQSIAKMSDLAETVAQNPQAATMFSVNWTMNGQQVGHTLVAVRDFMGGMSFIDRSGRIVKNLAELNDLYPGIKSAVLDAGTVIAENTMVVKSLGTVPTLSNIISQAATRHTPDKPTEAAPPNPPTGKSATLKPANLGNLSPEAKKIYASMGPGSPVLTYRQIMHRSGFFIDTVIICVDELVEKGNAVRVPGATLEPTLLQARRL
jgi:hypothetical protein